MLKNIIITSEMQDCRIEPTYDAGELEIQQAVKRYAKNRVPAIWQAQPNSETERKELFFKAADVLDQLKEVIYSQEKCARRQSMGGYEDSSFERRLKTLTTLYKDVDPQLEELFTTLRQIKSKYPQITEASCTKIARYITCKAPLLRHSSVYKKKTVPQIQDPSKPIMLQLHRNIPPPPPPQTTTGGGNERNTKIWKTGERGGKYYIHSQSGRKIYRRRR